MNDLIVNKWAMGLAVFSFGFLSIGSFLFGATATTSVLRGLGGGVLFGALLWLVGLLISEKEDSANDDIEEEGDTDQESVVVDTNAVKEKFLKKSAELEEKAKIEKEEEKEEKFNKEATPF